MGFCSVSFHEILGKTRIFRDFDFFFPALPDKDEQGNDIEDEFSSLPFPSQNFNRLRNKIFKTKKEIESPFSDKLLPDPLPEPFIQPKYTILLELTGLLVHSSWTVSDTFKKKIVKSILNFELLLGLTEFLSLEKYFVKSILDFVLLSLAGLTEFLSFEKYFVKSIRKGKELISRNFRKSS